MDIAEAKSVVTPDKKKKRVGRGRGSGNGKTCGRGMNGARSRSGWSRRNMEGGNIPLWRRLPKVGFTNQPFKTEYTPVNVYELNVFEPETKVTPEKLREMGVVKQPSRDGIKVLGDGSIDQPLTVRAHAFSSSARQKIEAAGGTVEVIPGPEPPVRNKMKQKASATAIVETEGEQVED
ncbi:MAG: 50S ribosomal protein L15 [Candidatus Brocadiia bacterium]